VATHTDHNINHYITHLQTRYTHPNRPAATETTEVTCTRRHTPTTLYIPLGKAKENCPDWRRRG